jgi:hypothetical protein
MPDHNGTGRKQTDANRTRPNRPAHDELRQGGRGLTSEESYPGQVANLACDADGGEARESSGGIQPQDGGQQAYPYP